MHKQISFYIDQFLSPYMCDYRKSFSTQHALLSLTEKWKKVLDNNGHGGAILMDLSKAFDTISHDLLIGKLHIYGFSKESFKLIRSYWQKTKLQSTFRSAKMVCSWPLLFVLFANIGTKLRKCLGKY